ncbi:MAG: hypothetical protein ACP5D9_06535, partial [Mariniphaga sp.]
MKRCKKAGQFTLPKPIKLSMPFRRNSTGVFTSRATKPCTKNTFLPSNRFEGTHPRVMQKRSDRMNWHVNVDLRKIKMKPKYRLLYFIEKIFGVRLFECRNY